MWRQVMQLICFYQRPLWVLRDTQTLCCMRQAHRTELNTALPGPAMESLHSG